MTTTSDRLDVTVTYDASCGYIATAPELKAPVVALSLGGLRRRIEIALKPDDVDVMLQLDRAARQEWRWRKGGKQGREQAWPR